VKVLLDTNVYLTALRSDVERERFRTTFFPLLPITVLSAVVAYELSVNAIGRKTMALLREFVAPMQQASRVITPTFEDWQTASEIMTGILRKDTSWKSKVPLLLNDVLIALTGRRAGAEVITYNGDDFRLIHRHLKFSLRVLST
jgi:predicted nucleic acid-binding protein